MATTGIPDRAALTALGLTDFRNYPSLGLSLEPSLVVLTGPNGAGKSNLLEAISFLSPGRGLRRARLAEVARQGGNGGWAVTATLSGPEGDTLLGTGLTLTPEGPERTRRVRVNRAPAASTDALLERLRVVWLTPAMDGLFTGPAADRRRFLDRLVLAIDPRHGQRVNAFERAMRGRNRLLSDFAPDPGWLDALEAQMAELAAAIAAARRDCIALMADAIARARPDPFPAARLEVSGTVETALADSAGAARDRYRADLAAGRALDRGAGRTLVGPHLSDLAVSHAAKNMPAGHCSTGEQKALLIAIVLAHARLIAGMSGRTPVVLLDEVAAHLDPERRAALFAILVDLGCQAFLTGTEPHPFAPLGDASRHFAVEDGRVIPAPAF